MSIKLRDLIRNVRACKTAAEERAVISKESASIRTAFKSEDSLYRFRNVAKLLYIHMLGYPTHFGQMECLKLIASPKFPEKRIGYLGMMLLLDDQQEVLSLAENSLHNDLSNSNQYVVGLALCTLGNVCNDEMASDLVAEVTKLHRNPNPYIRKKAALVLVRIFRRLPELIPEHADNIVLDTRQGTQHHGALVATVKLISDMCELEPEVISQYRQSVPALVKLLNSLINSGYDPEYDVSGFTDPFLHCAILSLLGTLGEGSRRASEEMSDTLAQVATNTETAKNPGYAIVYQCVQTILRIDCDAALRVLAINILGRFLLNRDNNIRYVALNTLVSVVGVDLSSVQRHRGTILDCLKDPDISIRRRALELSYQLVNEQHIESMSRELLNYLTVADSEFKEDLTSKLSAIFDRYAPNKRWHIDTMLQVLVLGGKHAREEVGASVISLVALSPELHAYATRKLYATFAQHIQFQTLMQVAVWCTGEFGDRLVAGDGNEGDDMQTPTDEEVVQTVEQVLKSGFSEQRTRFFCVNALGKLITRVSNPSVGQRIEKILAPYKESMNLEMQQRSCEYSALFQPRFQSIRSGILEIMPAVEQPAKEVEQAAPNSRRGAGRREAPEAREAAAAPAPASAPAPPAAAAAPPGGDLLLDLLMEGSEPASPAPAYGGSAGGGGGGGSDALLDLLSGIPSGPMNSSPSPAMPQPAPSRSQVDPMASMFGAQEGASRASSNGQAGPVPGGPAGDGQFVAYDKNGLRATFALSKPGPPNVVQIAVSFTNSTPAPLEAFSFQAAVPKYCKLQMGNPGGNSVPPNNSGSLSQSIRVMNSQFGQSPTRVLMRVMYSANGQKVQDQKPVDLPAGF